MVSSTQDNVSQEAGHRQTSINSSSSAALGSNVGRDFSVPTQLSKVGENLYVDLHDNNQRGITESTTGVATFQIKSSIGSFQLTSEQAYGQVIFVHPIDTALSSMSKTIGSQYVNYRITHLSITVRNVSPFATASGSVQVAYINDPNNIVTMNSNQIETLLRQTNSRQIGAKDTLDLDFNQTQLNVLGAPSGWKFCKPRGIPILDRYGIIAVAVRGVPAIGDGAQFVVSAAATLEFFGMTQNVDTTYVYDGLTDTGLYKDREITSCEYKDEYGDDLVSVDVNIEEETHLATGKYYTTVFAEARNFLFTITDEQDRKIDFSVQMKSCEMCPTTSKKLQYKFVARTQRMANLARPFKEVKCKLLNEHCTALVIVPHTDSQLIHEAPLDAKTKDELRLFESLNRAIDHRISQLAMRWNPQAS